MTELERGVVYTGAGIIKYKKERIGTADRVDFTITGIGFKAKKEESCYGTINGKIDKLGLIPELNSPHPTPVDLELTLEDKTKLVLKNVEVINQIPMSGKLSETEFHGPWKD